MWQQFGHGPFWLPRTVPAVAWKRKPVQRPGDLRSRVACSTALQRHCRARLQGLLNEAVQQDRRSVCNRKTMVSCTSPWATHTHTRARTHARTLTHHVIRKPERLARRRFTTDHTFIVLFQRFVTFFDESGRDQAAGERTSPTVLILCRSLSFQSGCVLNCVTLVVRLSFDDLMQFMLPESVCACV